MYNQLKFLFFTMSAGFILVTGFALAQETTTASKNQALNLDADILDTNIPAQNLGISEPGILPDSQFYFLKSWSRGIQQLFTFDSVKKAELNLKFTKEKLLEARKISEKTADSEVIKKAVENYRREVEKLKNQTDKIKDKADQNAEVGKFLDKFIQQQTLQQRILDKLETQAPANALEKIKTVKEEHLQKFGEVMTRLENKDEIQKRLEKNIEKIKGSDFIDFKNLEFLKKLEEKAPEVAKESIQKAQDNFLNRLEIKMEKMTPNQQKKFQEYADNISNEEGARAEILSSLIEKVKSATSTNNLIRLKEGLEQGKEKILKRIVPEKSKEQIRKAKEMIDKVEKLLREKPELAKDTAIGQLLENAKEKSVLAEEFQKNEKYGEAFGQATAALQDAKNALRKITKSEDNPTVCALEISPVCGKDGKNYSNRCFAEVAGTEVDYKRKCLSTIASTSPGSLFCENDSDCGCGIKKEIDKKEEVEETKECFLGNKKYVDESVQCPDFCFGIGGNLKISCINNECQQVNTK